jgi:hypothetical protein
MKRQLILLIPFIIFEYLAVLFYQSDLKIDLYLFYDYERYLCNVMHDIGFYYILIVLFYILWVKVSYYYFAFFIWRIAEFIGYFLVASQKTNIITLPLLLLLLLWIKRKNID